MDIAQPVRVTSREPSLLGYRRLPKKNSRSRRKKTCSNKTLDAINCIAKVEWILIDVCAAASTYYYVIYFKDKKLPNRANHMSFNDEDRWGIRILTVFTNNKVILR